MEHQRRLMMLLVSLTVAAAGAGASSLADDGAASAALSSALRAIKATAPAAEPTFIDAAGTLTFTPVALDAQDDKPPCMLRKNTRKGVQRGALRMVPPLAAIESCKKAAARRKSNATIATVGADAAVLRWHSCWQAPQQIYCNSAPLCAGAGLAIGAVTVAGGSSCHCLAMCRAAMDRAAAAGSGASDGCALAWVNATGMERPTAYFSIWSSDGGSVLCAPGSDASGPTDDVAEPAAAEEAVAAAATVPTAPIGSWAPAQYKSFLPKAECSWLREAARQSLTNVLKCGNKEPADSEWYHFSYNSGPAYWSAVGLNNDIYRVLRPDCGANQQCPLVGCARELCCVSLCADVVVRGGSCSSLQQQTSSGLKMYYSIQPRDAGATACDPRGGGTKGTGTGRRGGSGRHLLAAQADTGAQPATGEGIDAENVDTTSGAGHSRRLAQASYYNSLVFVTKPYRNTCPGCSASARCDFYYEIELGANGSMKLWKFSAQSTTQSCDKLTNDQKLALAAQML